MKKSREIKMEHAVNKLTNAIYDLYYDGELSLGEIKKAAVNAFAEEFTQQEVSEILDVSPRSIRNWKNGKRFS